MEVAEHLPAECAQNFIRSLVSLAPLVLFSAAIPFQGGTNHVNEQWPAYWAELFRTHGYSPIDCIRPYVWNDPRVEWWYAQNTFLYANAEGLSNNFALAQFSRQVSPSQLSIVHPRNYLTKASPQNPGLRKALLLTAVAVKRALAKRVGRI
jgi:hypothetical protein